ncbi:hypothetical protein HMPREF0072_1965, partial [Anaerococcus lactolyticus ATCC 51172]
MGVVNQATEFTAKFKKKTTPPAPSGDTTDDVIPYLPGETVPTKGSDNKDIPATYITVTFKAEVIEGAAAGTVTVKGKTGAVVYAK